MNVCYIGVDNLLSAAALGCDAAHLRLSTKNGEITRQDERFIYRPCQPGNTEIAAYCVKGRDSVLIGQAAFRVKELPSPRARVGGKWGGAIRKTVLLNQAGIEAVLEGFDFDARFVVTSCKFSIRRSAGSVTAALAGGSAYFTPEVKAAMQTLNTGDQVILDDIRCVGPDRKTRDCGTVVLIVE